MLSFGCQLPVGVHQQHKGSAASILAEFVRRMGGVDANLKEKWWDFFGAIGIDLSSAESPPEQMSIETAIAHLYGSIEHLAETPRYNSLSVIFDLQDYCEFTVIFAGENVVVRMGIREENAMRMIGSLAAFLDVSSTEIQNRVLGVISEAAEHARV